jgi:Bax protein
MKTFLILIVLIFTCKSQEINPPKTKPLTIKQKKQNFYDLILPHIQEVDDELRTLFIKTKEDIKNHKNLSALFKKYKTDNEKELLKRIKPHPISITIAQAIIESGWGTSRFFKEANNIFGMWSKSTAKNTIKASQTRKDGRVIHLARYKDLSDSIRAYYKNIATNPAYKKFREARFRSKDPYEIAAYLNNYSEKKDLYPVELIKIIYYNKLTRYDKPLEAK